MRWGQALLPRLMRGNGFRLHQGVFRSDTRKKKKSLKEWPGTGMSCPERWWGHHSRDAWVWPLGAMVVVLGRGFVTLQVSSPPW